MFIAHSNTFNYKPEINKPATVQVCDATAAWLCCAAGYHSDAFNKKPGKDK
jgi:hypothetical protein